MIPLWPHQQRCLDEVRAAIGRGESRILVTSPTGGGKTRVMCELAEEWVGQGLKVAIYTNRKLLVEQTSRVLTAAGIDHGHRSAEYEDDNGFCPVQICSVQTEDARVFKSGRWELHPADRVIVDEAHSQTAETMQKILTAHHEQGAAYVGFTATPIGLAGLYDCLLAAGTTSELRACGALVRCLHFGPDEPDLKRLKNYQPGTDLSEKQNRDAMMTPTIWGRVWKWFEKLNPAHKPTIVFATDVAGSLWFAEQFCAKGVPAAHIDGASVWVNGKMSRTSRQARQDILGASKDGRLRVLCNRFVLREGVDAPWLGHAVFATVFGVLQSYLQAGGRILRAYPGLETVTIQDHGGNWWRHGSLNADRQWHLDYSPSMVYGVRADRIRAGKEPEPFRCPRCAMIVLCGKCRLCSWEPDGQIRSRPVVSVDGALVEMEGPIFPQRTIYREPDGPYLWERMYNRAKSAKWNATFSQAIGYFAYEYGRWPDPEWKFMPLYETDKYRKVAEVPKEMLRQ